VAGASTSMVAIGTVSELWRFPVKSMLGERLQRTELTAHGFAGDRAYALVDVETGKPVTAKNVKHFPRIMELRAEFVEEPQPGEPLPAARVRLPDGTSTTSDAPDADAVLSRWLGRDVSLTQSPAGQPFFDLHPVSIITNATLEHLHELAPTSQFAQRRFRKNIVAQVSGSGFVENAWVGRSVRIGGACRLHVEMPVSRCIMTTLAQEELPNDPEIMRTLVRHNTIQASTRGQRPCAGVYALPTTGGALCVGDAVMLEG
jgi:uncharacterized protein YcbX